ncbi:glycosyltransferase family 4 protein [Gottfriedia sp. NPDC056225]|uniref:glycosyltransferase family 4 protein n=1 Tax=Gottfriedia sp. NPDC056225 TaxID=3345751 RepID=UPI001558720D|nr:glycosyltransferase family 4 protein [Arthrobacter citreus]
MYRKKILLISQHFYPEIGSAANRLKNIYLELKEKNYEVKVLTLQPRYPSRELYEDKSFWNEPLMDESDFIRIDPSIKTHSGNIVKRLYLYIEVMIRFIFSILLLRKEYDAVFVTSPPIFVGVAGLIAKWKLKAPLIVDIRDLWPESLTGVKLFTNRFILNTAYKVEEILYKKADRIIVNSLSFVTYMTGKGVPKDKISFMPNSLTEEELNGNEPVVKSEGDHVNVIYTGNLGMAQDIQKLIRVIEKMKDESKVRFIILGYGYHSNDLQRIINEKNLTNVTIHSAKSRKETLDLVSNSDIAYVSLVDQDVFKTVLPGKIIDYMCVKKPIIGDVSGYASDIIRSADCGIVSDVNTVEELVKNITILANDRELRKQYGENGYNYAFENLRWKTNISVLTRLLEEIHE